MQKSHKGFTIIELLIIIAIIGILAAIAIPSFLKFQLKAKSSEAKINIAAIRDAEITYHDEYDRFVSASVFPESVWREKQSWEYLPTNHGFRVLGWTPKGNTYFQYAVIALKNSFQIEAWADLDGNGEMQCWIYIHDGPDMPVYWGGAYDEKRGYDIKRTVGPCEKSSYRSVF